MRRCQSSISLTAYHLLTHSMTDEILRPLGQGTFGKVVCARDNETGRDVAVKIMYVLQHSPSTLLLILLPLHSRAIPKYREASKVEIKVLNFLQEHDPENK